MLARCANTRSPAVTTESSVYDAECDHIHTHGTSMCSDDACLANCDVTGYSTPSSTALALMDSDVTGNTVAYPSNEFLAKCQTYVSLDADTLALYDSEWTRLGISSAG